MYNQTIWQDAQNARLLLHDCAKGAHKNARLKKTSDLRDRRFGVITRATRAALASDWRLCGQKETKEDLQ
ncbi:MAG: hypothetical protein OGM67_11420 [Oscillospiraceae bacterium]|nr:MAG: hypothetical protein OGM67_11420 [Oscillospiraceae bacterium]